MLCSSLFANDPQKVAVHAGNPLIVEGETADLGTMYILTQGEARVLVGGVEVERLRIGDPVGELSLIDRLPHSGTVEAITDCEFVCVDEKHFKFMVSTTPGFALDIMKTLARRLRETDKLIQ